MTAKEPTLDANAWRILDANSNRVLEGLRVVEECFRFQIQDSKLSASCKSLRHQLSRTIAAWLPAGNRVACRSTDTDVGTQIQTRGEYQRATPRDIAHANLRRVLESLRVLEEYGKLVSPEFAQAVEAARYEAYTLEKQFGHLLRASERWHNAQLYVLVDGRFGWHDEFWSRIERIGDSEVDVVQLRAKREREGACDRLIADIACQLSERLRGAGKLFVMNDRADIALLARADGVHVGQDELRVHQVRQVVGPDMAIGVSTHNVEQVREAVRAGADYLGVGPVFSSKTKEFTSFAGVEFVREAHSETSLPCFPIGGVDATRLPELCAAGAQRVAVSHAVWQASDIVNAAAEMKRMLPSQGSSGTDEPSGCDGETH